MVADFDKESAQVLAPRDLAHVVLRTNNFDKMVAYYKTFLGARSVHETENLSFLTYDHEHHRVAIVAIPGTKAKEPTACGLEHMAFSFASLSDLLLSYRQRKSKGIEPFWSVNHGPTTSIYYRDPDGNVIETQVENFSTPDEATEFMKSKYFEENPMGTDFDPESFILRLKNGASEKELAKRVEIGPRALPSFS